MGLRARGWRLGLPAAAADSLRAAAAGSMRAAGCALHAGAVAAAYEVEGDRERGATAESKQDRLQLLAGVHLSQGTGEGVDRGPDQGCGLAMRVVRDAG